MAFKKYSQEKPQKVVVSNENSNSKQEKNNASKEKEDK